MSIHDEIEIRGIETARGTQYLVGMLRRNGLPTVNRIETRIRQFNWAYRVHLNNGHWIEVLDVVEVAWAIVPGKVK